ncbi:MAG: hypothetical protein HDR17_15585 [Lachnospiraceae bacterium]|nr:hypothetical protein [Lachnospiraceae bacterium]MBD5506036.1 hypothetical protein [Lachnospiraceae bacterium]
MIHDIEDEKRKIRRNRGDDFSGGLSDEALAELIGQVEAEEMIHAPRQLKGNIFAQIRRERRAAKKRQVFAYRVKVLAAMAAALAVLFLMPNDLSESIDRAPVEHRTENEDIEKMAAERQKDKEDNWEKYLAERERGGVRGFLDDMNERVTQFGTSLYENIGKGSDKE